MDNVSEEKRQGNTKKKLIIIVSAFFMLMIISVLIFLLQSKTATTSKLSQSPTKAPLPTPTIPSPPKIEFGSYDTKNLPFSPLSDSVNSYTLKENFSDRESKEFAQKFGLSTSKKLDNNTVVFTEYNNPSKISVLHFYKNTGFFTYNAFGANVFPNNQNETLFQKALTLTQTLGFQDNLITCNTSYTKNNEPDITYIECHRTWNALSLPLLSLPGLLNLPQNKSLSTLALGETFTDSPVDQNIVGISNAKSGYARPNDFNTITFAFYSDGGLYSIESKLRFINMQQAISATNLLTQEEALEKFKMNKANTTLSLPAGQGLVDYKKVYADNKAFAHNAVITDIRLSYLEKSGISSQSEYSPYYLIKGSARLVNGFSINFVQSIPAERNKVLTLNPVKKTVLGENIQVDSFGPTLGDATFFSPPVPSLTQVISAPPATAVFPTVPPPVSSIPQCENNSSQPNQITLNVPDYGILTILTKQYGPHTFFFVSSSGSTDFNSVKKAIYKVSEDQFVINTARAMIYPNQLEKPRSFSGNYEPPPDINKNPKTLTDMSEIYNILYFGKKVCDRLTPSSAYTMATIPSFCLADYLEKIDTSNLTEIAQSVQNNETGSERGSGDYISYNFDTASYKSTITAASQKFINYIAQNYSIKDLADAKPYSENGVTIYPQGTQGNNILPMATSKSLAWIFLNFGSHPNLEKQCYITGVSPIIFFYPEINSDIKVHLSTSVTYSNPSLQNNIWNIFAKSNSEIISQSQTYPYIYYEYNRSITLSDTNTGFVIPTNHLSSEVQKIANTFGLNGKETESFVHEIINALPENNNSPYLKLTLVDQKEIEKKLPLEITPKPQRIFRIHFIITPIDTKESIDEPTLKVLRNKFTVVEIAARTN